MKTGKEKPRHRMTDLARYSVEGPGGVFYASLAETTEPGLLRRWTVAVWREITVPSPWSFLPWIKPTVERRLIDRALNVRPENRAREMYEQAKHYADDLARGVALPPGDDDPDWACAAADAIGVDSVPPIRGETE